MTDHLALGKALNLGLRHALEQDDKVVLMGEDIGRLGGVFRVTDGLQKDFGPDRVRDTPLAESAIVGTAVGLAMRGYRPVIEIQFDGFVFVAFDQIVNHVARLHFRSRGSVRMPIVIRIPYGGGIGAVEHHSESPETFFAHVPGLRVVTCGTSQDAYSLIRHAIASDDPVVFLEPKRRYWLNGQVDTSRTDDSWSSSVLRSSPESTATLVTYGPLVPTAIETAEVLAAGGVEIDVIDLRTLSPLDLEPVFESVRTTGRLVVAHEAPGNLGLGAEVAARVAEECFYSLESPILRVTGYDIPYPPSRIEHDYLPDVDRIIDAIERAEAF
ncbi:MAG: alpha-ketoacid dehydrogenase subunit beta [Aeromicrobium sp.]|nr:MAG: alpha-ketoacid dehydrogenase subunit beta [Aeromicrobium sp.]